MCRRQAAALLVPLVLWVLFGNSTQALSTFGVSNTRAPTPARPTTPPAPDKNKMWKASTILPIWLSLYLVGPCSGAFSPVFGVIKTESPYPPPSPTPLTARPCQRQSDCAGISASSCVRTHYDAVTRCLCGDNLPPNNGQCEAQTKALYHVCANSDECNDGLICAAPNVTSAAPPPHLRVHAPTDKLCLCDVEGGFKEKEHLCNDADIVTTSVFAVAVVSLFRTVLNN